MQWNLVPFFLFLSRLEPLGVAAAWEAAAWEAAAWLAGSELERSLSDMSSEPSLWALEQASAGGERTSSMVVVAGEASMLAGGVV